MKANQSTSLVTSLVGVLVTTTLLAVGPTVGHADEIVFMKVKTDPPEPLIPWDVSLEAEIGSDFGATQIGTKTFAQTLGTIGAGVSIGRATFMLGYQMGSTHRSIGDGELLRGSTHRFRFSLGVRVLEQGNDVIGGVTTVGVGSGRQFIFWDQGRLSRRDVFVFVEQSLRFGFRLPQHAPVKAPSSLRQSLRVELIASRTPPFAIAPVSATKGPTAETDIGFLIGFVLRFSN